MENPICSKAVPFNSPKYAGHHPQPWELPNTSVCYAHEGGTAGFHIRQFLPCFSVLLPYSLLPFNQLPSRQAFCTLTQIWTISRAFRPSSVWREPRGRWIPRTLFSSFHRVAVMLPNKRFTDIFRATWQHDRTWETWDPATQHNTRPSIYLTWRVYPRGWLPCNPPACGQFLSI